MVQRLATIPPLTGIRAFAALWVVANHLQAPISKLAAGSERLIAFVESGFLGIDLFAFLSGFVISYNYAERLAHPDARGVARFVGTRFARVFPLHWFSFAAILVLQLGIENFDPMGAAEGFYGSADAWLSALMVHGWGVADTLSWNVPSWTVSAEWFCYLCFPLAAPLLARIRSADVCALLALTTAAATVEALRQLGFEHLNANVSWGLLRIGGEFASGCLLYRAWALGFGAGWRWGWIGLAFLGLAIALTGWHLSTWVVLCFPAIVYALAANRGPLALLFGNAPMVFVGEISYSIYLTHWILIKGMARFVPSLPNPSQWQLAVVVALSFALVLAVSALTYYGVERPARRRLRRWIGTDRPTG